MTNPYKARLSVEQLEPLTPPSDITGIAVPEYLPEIIQQAAEVTAEVTSTRVRVQAWDPGEDELLDAVATYQKAGRRLTAEGDKFWVWRLNTGGRVVTSIFVAPALDPTNPYVRGIDYKGNWRPDTSVLKLTMYRSGGYLVNVNYEDGGYSLHLIGAGFALSETIFDQTPNPRHRTINTPEADLILIQRQPLGHGGTGFIPRSVRAFEESGQRAKIVRPGPAGQASTVGSFADAINRAYRANGNQPISVIICGYGDQSGWVTLGQALSGDDPLGRISPSALDTVGLNAFIAGVGQGKLSSLTILASYSGKRWDQPDGLIQQLANGLQTRVWGYTGSIGVTAPTRINFEQFQTLHNSALVATDPR